MHYATETVIASSECTTLKQAVPGKCVIKVLFLVTVTFSQADALKLTAASVFDCFGLVTSSDLF